MRRLKTLIHSFLALTFMASALFLPKSTFAQSVTADPSTLTGRQQSEAIINQLLQNGRIIRSSDVKRGMRGYGLSVFQGTKIEKFPIEVLGVLQRVQGGGDVVLIKVLGGPVVERQSGIIAGMSGSPVYIDGKMLGAIALGWGFPKEPIGGVTPITEMIGTSLPQNMGTRQAALTPEQSTRPAVYVPRESLQVDGKEISRVVVPANPTRLALGTAQKQTTGRNDTALMRHTSTLLQVSGFSQDSLPQLKQIFEPYGLEPFIGPSSKKTGVPSPKLEPGSAVGVQLVSGDMDQTAIGTITFRWGNRVLGFGHPMFGQGTASLPMASAYVHEIFPSYQRSFKLASPIDVVGAVQQDTQFAIGGTVHSKADTIPMQVHLVDAPRQINKNFRVQVMNDPLLTPQLVTLVAQEAVNSTLGLASDKMVEVKLRIDVAGAQPIIRHNLLYSDGVVSGAALMDLRQSIALTQSNPFAKGAIRRITLEANIKPGRNIAIIKSMTANRNKIKAGESVQVDVVLQSAAQPTKHFERSFTFDVPRDARSGTLSIVAASSANYWPMRVAIGGSAPEFSNLTELITAWNKVGALNELTVMASTPQRVLRIDQQDAQNPPPSLLQLLGTAPALGAKAFNHVQIQSSDTNYMIDGARILRIPVESADKSPEADTGTDAGASADESPATDSTDATADDGAAEGEGESTAPTPKNTFKAAKHQWATSSNWAQQDWPEKVLMQTKLPLEAPAAPAKSAESTEKTKDAAADKTTTDTTKDTATPSTISKTLGRPALNWVDSGAANFLKGEFSGAVVDSEGIIRPAPLSRQLATTTLPFIWSIAGDNAGNVYLGSGAQNEAILYRLNKDGKQEPIFQTPGMAISALTAGSDGTLYAATTPDGKIYRITSDGKAELLLDTKQSFIWALEWDANGALLIGTGGEHGALWRIRPQDDKSTFSDRPLHTFTEGHVRAVSVADNGAIYVGTGAPGVLYQVDPATGDATALYEITVASGKHSGEILAVTALNDAVYFGTSLSGTLYRWTSDGGALALYPSPQKAVYALRHDAAGLLYMATGNSGVVYLVRPGNDAQSTKASRILEPTQMQSLALALAQSETGDSTRLLVATGNNGAAYEIPLVNASNGTFTSRVYDATKKARWGAIRPIGQNVVIQTRSGNTTTPDANWSDWAQATALVGGELQVTSPPARFLQYKVLLASNSAPAPAFARVAISYQVQNQPPQLAITAPKGGEYWSGKKSITWTATDPDKDTLRYTINLINQARESKPVSETPIKASPFSLDTKKWADGRYTAEVQASDILSNPLDPQTIAVITLPFVIDNTAPIISGARIETGGANKQLIKASVSDALSPIVGVEWRVTATKTEKKTEETAEAASAENAQSTSSAAEQKDEKAAEDEADAEADSDEEATDSDTKDDDGWRALAAADGLFDSLQEDAIGILLLTEKEKAGLAAKTMQIELRAHDAAGNTVTIVLPFAA